MSFRNDVPYMGGKEKEVSARTLYMSGKREKGSPATSYIWARTEMEF